MESLLTIGFPAALSLKGLGLCFIGALVGMLLGAILGLAPAIVAVLSLTFSGEPASSIALLAGLYWGAQFGRSVTAILFGVPGGASAIPTTFDGFALTNQGRAGRALGATLIASFLACTVATVFIAILARSVSGIALLLGPAEYVALMVLALAVTVATAGGAVPKAMIMVLLGLLLARVGTNIETGEVRFTFGLSALENGPSGYAVTLGLIAFSAALIRFETAPGPLIAPAGPGPLLPRWSDVRETIGPMLRGSVVGTLSGLLPVGALIGPFVAYRLERSLAKERERFGTGAIEGVAAAESANNAGAQAALLPLVTLGLPTNTVMAILIATFTLSGAVPGPRFIVGAPELYWGTVATFWIANLMVVAIGLGTIAAWVRLLMVPRRLVLGTLIVLGCALVYAVDYNPVDVGVAASLGLLGWVLTKRGFEPMPMLIAFLLGQSLEENVRRGLLVSRGSLMTFIERPLTAGILLFAFVVLAGATWAWIAGRKTQTAAP